MGHALPGAGALRFERRASGPGRWSIDSTAGWSGYHLGDVRTISLADARYRARKIMLAVADGKDPAGDRKAERALGTFADLAQQYLELHAKRHNKSWRQADALVRRNLLPRWGKLKAAGHHQGRRQGDGGPDRGADRCQPDPRRRVCDILVGRQAGDLHRQSLQAGRAKPDHQPRARAQRRRDQGPVRDLDFGTEADPPDRPKAGEVSAMEREHVVDGWWNLAGKTAGTWPGTKNGRDHRVWLSEPALALVESHFAEEVSAKRSAKRMTKIVTLAKIERCTPHDLRRTCLTMVTRLGLAATRWTGSRTTGPAGSPTCTTGTATRTRTSGSCRPWRGS